MATLFGIFFLLVGAFAADSTNTTKVPVTVYYESLCTDSIKFIKDKLEPTYNSTVFSFKELFSNLTLVPYGKVNTTGPTPVCQHGPSECMGNKIHACAINYIPDKSLQLKFISCLMEATALPVNQSLPYPQPEVCATILGTAYNVSIITGCASGKEGEELFKKYGDMTNEFLGTNFNVPYIAFNNTKDDALSTEARKNFRKVLCSKVGVNKDVCTDVGGGASAISASLSLIAAITCFLFFVKQ